jgi:hypothetical protein
MALIPHCDRCKQPGQVIPVLGMDLCNGCVADAKAWLGRPYLVPARGKKIDRLAQASNLLDRMPRITASYVAEMSGEPVRSAYWGLMALAKRGVLVHLGDGVFERPRAVMSLISTKRESA